MKGGAGRVQQIEAELALLRQKVEDLKNAGDPGKAREFYDKNVVDKETELYFAGMKNARPRRLIGLRNDH